MAQGRLLGQFVGCCGYICYSIASFVFSDTNYNGMAVNIVHYSHELHSRLLSYKRLYCRVLRAGVSSL